MFYAIVTRHKASGGGWKLWTEGVYETEAHAAIVADTNWGRTGVEWRIVQLQGVPQ